MHKWHKARYKIAEIYGFVKHKKKIIIVWVKGEDTKIFLN